MLDRIYETCVRGGGVGKYGAAFDHVVEHGSELIERHCPPTVERILFFAKKEFGGAVL